MAGRPRAIQGEVEKRLLEALTTGLTIRLACQFAGITQTTYHEEVNRNPEFAERAMRARLTHLPEALDQVRRHGRDDWRAAAKFLELVAPEDFNRSRVEVTQAEPLKITLDFGNREAPAPAADESPQSE